jgi:hypothetical protein
LLKELQKNEKCWKKHKRKIRNWKKAYT